MSSVWSLSYKVSCLNNSTLTFSNAITFCLYKFISLSKRYLISLDFLIVHVMTSQWLQNCIDDDDAIDELSKVWCILLNDDVDALFKGLIKLLT